MGKSRGGVYLITCLANGKVYVGSSGVSVRTRMSSHLRALRQQRHFNRYLQRAWDKYGEATFKFEVLLLCSPAKAIKLEQRFIDELEAANPAKGFNNRSVAESNLGMVFGEETRRKLSLAKKGVPKSAEHRRKIGEALKGRKINRRWRALLKAKATGTKRSEEHRLAISEGLKRHYQNPKARQQLSRRLMGRKFSRSTRAKISEANRLRWKLSNERKLEHA